MNKLLDQETKNKFPKRGGNLISKIPTSQRDPQTYSSRFDN